MITNEIVTMNSTVMTIDNDEELSFADDETLDHTIFEETPSIVAHNPNDEAELEFGEDETLDVEAFEADSSPNIEYKSEKPDNVLSAILSTIAKTPTYNELIADFGVIDVETSLSSIIENNFEGITTSEILQENTQSQIISILCEKLEENKTILAEDFTLIDTKDVSDEDEDFINSEGLDTLRF